jgi:RNA polymerase sigma-70 factor (ECF subfamily)
MEKIMRLDNIFKHNKNKRYFEEQMSLIYKDIYKFIYSIIKNKHLTEDILQETLMKAYEKFHTIRDIQKFKPWIFSIARNESLSWIKKYNREIPSEDTYLELSADSLGDIPEELLIKSETKEKIRESIKVLKSIDQEIMYLRYYYDLTLNEIALVLNMNENTVRTKHIRAKEKIYKHIVCDESFLEIAATTIEKKEVE